MAVQWGIDYTKGFIMNNQYIPTSFVQNQKHLTKTDKFQVIVPESIEAILNDYGFDLVHLKSGKAKSQDRQDFQTTVARYRSRDAFEIDGLSFDLIFKVPHLYGKLIGVLGLFRGVCANQMNVGQWFECIKVSHLGSPMDALRQMIPDLIAQRAKLIAQVNSMSSRDVTPAELQLLAKEVSEMRLDGVKNITRIESQDLLRPRRLEDTKSDLFTVLNVLQENVMRHGIRYQTSVTDTETGVISIRNYNARKVSDKSVKAIDLNGSIWDIATKLLNVAA